MGLNRELLATYMRNKMRHEQMSLRKAAESAGCSPATFSRLLGGEDNAYTPDTTTLNAVSRWLGKTLSEFETTGPSEIKSLEDVSVHLHALPDLRAKDAEFIMDVVKLMYEDRRKRPSPEK